MVLVIGLVSLSIFAGKIISYTVYEYSNELFCIFEYHSKGQSLSFYLVPVLSICVEHRLRYV